MIMLAAVVGFPIELVAIVVGQEIKEGERSFALMFVLEVPHHSPQLTQLLNIGARHGRQQQHQRKKKAREYSHPSKIQINETNGAL